MLTPARPTLPVVLSILLLTLPSFAVDSTETELRGRVVVQSTERPVAEAVVTLVELDRRTVTDKDGDFRFTKLPRGNFTLGIHALGFASVHRVVEIPSGSPLVVSLDADSHFKEEVTVTALPFVANPLDSSQSVDMIDQREIRAKANNSVGETLERVPGLANISVGDALGTPVIRGTSENRTRVLNDGVQTNYQQWSFRHSPNLEPAFAERVEVVRGPASVMWGPDAMGGVVNLVRPPLPSAQNGKTVFHGDVGVGYLSNNAQGQGQVVLEGAVGGFGWRAGVIRRNAGDLETPEGSLPNTDYAQTNATAEAGYSAGWGSLRLRWNRWDDDVGFYFPPGHPNDGFRLDLLDNSYSADVTLPVGPGDLEVLLSHQDNVRKAYPPSSPVYPDPAVDLDADTDVARLGFQHKRFGAWRGKIATEYQGLSNLSSGPATLVPTYEGDNVALMALEEGRFLPAATGDHDRLILNLGLRYDSTDASVPAGASSLVPPGGFDRTYGALTGSAGAVYRFTEHLSLAANLGRGWRPPSAFELFAEGEHVGVGAFQIGNPSLTEESSVSGELSLRYRSVHWRAVLTGYQSRFDDYIYLADVTGDPGLPPGIPEPVFSYEQSDATIDGIELTFDVVPLEYLQLGALFSNVNTENEATGTKLPQTPPDRVSLTVRGMARDLGPLASPLVELEWMWVDDGVPSGPDEPFWGSGNAATNAYDLWNLRAGFQVSGEAGVFGANVTVRNLLNTTYTDFLYPYKVWGVPNPGRDLRLLLRYQF
jgi:outer membrane receptor protein involved in Fe transport